MEEDSAKTHSCSPSTRQSTSVWVSPEPIIVLVTVTSRHSRPAPTVKETPAAGGFVPSSWLTKTSLSIRC